MAERRMFAKTIIDSDEFLDMPASTQLLYFHLGMRADDDGFINGPKKILRMVGSSDDDLKLLIAKQFVIAFESGIVVIRHWKMHNYIQKDRYKKTVYVKERAQLALENNTYELLDTECIQNGYKLDTTCIQDGYTLDTQDRIGKDRLELGKVSLGKDRLELELDKDTRHTHGRYRNVFLSDYELDILKSEFDDYQKRIDRLSTYMYENDRTYPNHLETIERWAKQDKQKSNKGKGLGTSFLDLKFPDEE